MQPTIVSRGINPSTGEIIFENQYLWNCNNGTQHIPFSLNHCTGNLCQNLEIKITASNPCFGTVSESLQWQAPNVDDYDLQVSNLVSNDFEFNFDWNIPNTYQYVKIQVWNEAKTQKICEWYYDRCSSPMNTTNPYHFDIRDCLGPECFAQCKNYKVVLETKQYCNSLISTKQIAWNKSNTTFAMPVNYPNIITADNDGINDDLCFTPTGADWYDIVIKNRWGNVMHEEQGCVDQIPICMWHPSINTTDGEYFYTIVFSNQCNYSDELTASILVLADPNSGLAQNNNPQQHQNSEYAFLTDQDGNQIAVTRENTSNWVVSAYPNPAEDIVFIRSSEEIIQITLRDIFGKEILSKVIHDKNTSISISNYACGYYILDVNGSTGIKSINLIKQ
ncbi:MAG: T9SS type A sorting domain-containing protein [Fluviicola sp.]